MFSIGAFISFAQSSMTIQQTITEGTNGSVFLRFLSGIQNFLQRSIKIRIYFYILGIHVHGGIGINGEFEYCMQYVYVHYKCVFVYVVGGDFFMKYFIHYIRRLRMSLS